MAKWIPSTGGTEYSLKTYRFQGGAAYLVKTTVLPAGTFPHIFLPEAKSGGLIMTGYDDPNAQTGFWIRCWSTF
jgi:hypothetical protein